MKRRNRVQKLMVMMAALAMGGSVLQFGGCNPFLKTYTFCDYWGCWEVY